MTFPQRIVSLKMQFPQTFKIFNCKNLCSLVSEYSSAWELSQKLVKYKI